MKITHSKFITSIVKTEQIPETGFPEYAFIGRSNVGKSSLINTVLQRKNLVKVSATPGKTQTINYFEVNNQFYIVDLPGYGYAKVSKSERRSWSHFISDYLTRSPYLKIVFLLIDARHEIKASDREMAAFLQENSIPYFLIATKRDKLSNNQWSKQHAALLRQTGLKAGDIIPFSSVTGDGRDEVLKLINRSLHGEM